LASSRYSDSNNHHDNDDDNHDTYFSDDYFDALLQQQQQAAMENDQNNYYDPAERRDFYLEAEDDPSDLSLLLYDTQVDPRYYNNNAVGGRGNSNYGYKPKKNKNMQGTATGTAAAAAAANGNDARPSHDSDSRSNNFNNIDLEDDINPFPFPMPKLPSSYYQKDTTTNSPKKTAAATTTRTDYHTRAMIVAEVEDAQDEEDNYNDNDDDLQDDINPFPFPMPKKKPFEPSTNEIISSTPSKPSSSSTAPPKDPFADIMYNNDNLVPEPPPVTIPKPPQANLAPSLETNRLQDNIASLQQQLQRVEQEIYTMNNNGAFNLNSVKQVSQVLYGGRPDQPTNKATLEGMATSNILAKLILEYRHVKQQLNKLVKKQERFGKSQETRQTNTSNRSSSPYQSQHQQDPVWLIDTSSFIFRAYYSMPPLHRSPDGMPIGAVMGFCNMLNRLVLNDMMQGKRPRLVLCLDAPISEDDPETPRTFRHELYPDYKGHRPSLPLDLIPQFQLIAQAAKAYGMISIQAPGFEADDVMATLGTMAYRQGLHVKILSGDKDLMQLITKDDDDVHDDDNSDNANNHNNNNNHAVGSIQMMDPMSMTPWTYETVQEKWNVPAEQLGDVLALAGDTADNVPGVPGIGPKIAAQLLQEFGTLQTLLDNVDQVKQKGRREKLQLYKEQALLSRELVELVRDLNWTQMEIFYPDQEGAVILGDESDDQSMDSVMVGDLRMEEMDPDRLLQFYDAMGFHTIKQRFVERLSRQPNLQRAAAGNAAAAASPKPKRGKFTPRRTMSVPNPEDYSDIPF
jgi:5'-3' exonuclease